jgi:hypothetical protein
MTELGPNARSLIQLARREDDPDDATRERVHDAFCARLNSGPTVPGDHSLASSAAQRALALKSGALLAVFVAALGGGWATYSQPATAPGAGSLPSSSRSTLASSTGLARRVEQLQPPLGEGQKAEVSNRSADSSDSVLETRRGAHVTGTLPELARATTTRGAKGASSPKARESSPAARGEERGKQVEGSPLGKPSQTEVERSASNPDSAVASGAERAVGANEALLAEAHGLREVQKLLRGGNSARALARLAEQEHEFATGQLIEARAAARAMAECSSQPAEARQKTASAFAARWPGSILLPSVRSACESRRSTVDERAD